MYGLVTAECGAMVTRSSQRGTTGQVSRAKARRISHSAAQQTGGAWVTGSTSANSAVQFSIQLPQYQ